MKTSSAKAKGRQLQQWVCAQIGALLGIQWGKDEQIASREMGQSGTDVRLIGEARVNFPFSVETKSQATWTVPAAIAQAKANQEPGRPWLLVMERKSRTPAKRIAPVVILDAEVFFYLLQMAEPYLTEDNMLNLEVK